MNYYYDVLVNLEDTYHMFYEWDQDDDVKLVKKIPLFHISGDVYKDLLTKKIRISNEFLKNIENKTKIKQNEYWQYACIFGDGKNSIVLEFDNNGLVISKSSLMLEDEININEFMYTVNESNISFEIVSDELVLKDTKQDMKVKQLLGVEIKSMYEKKEYSKLKYVYLEWFDHLLDDTEEMYNNMLNKLKMRLTEKDYAIYELIKLSYNNV